jgi:hypothetical protein
MQVVPIGIAKELWEVSPAQGISKSEALRNLPAKVL